MTKKKKAQRKIKFNNIYGGSYFGSGGGYGGIQNIKNAEVFGVKDNGFMSGPAGARVLDPSKPAKVVARGGDCINDGRTWTETYEWDVQTQTWQAA